jgi:Flp pilus assembly protein TadD
MKIGFEGIGNWVDKLTSSTSANDDPDPAFREYHQAIRLRPKDAEAYVRRALAYLKAGKMEQTIQDLDQAIQLNPGHAEAYLKRGITLAESKNYPAAVRDFDKVASLQPNEAEAYWRRALAYVELGQDQQAIRDTDRAVQLQASEPQAFIAAPEIGVDQVRPKLDCSSQIADGLLVFL